MSDKVKETQEKLKEQGYFASEKLSKLITTFEGSGRRDRKNIPVMFLEGMSGAGKTFLGETFSKMVGADLQFVQCFPKMGAENFHKDLDAEAVIDKQVNGTAQSEVIVKAVEFFAKISDKEDEFYKIFNIDKDKPITQEDLKDNRSVVQLGILLRALEQSHKGPVVVLIDELDKSRPEVDSFLLDYFESGRLSTGTEVFTKGQYPIWAFITSNGNRQIDSSLLDRCRRIEVPRPEKNLFLEILGLPEDHYIGKVYDKCPDFSIRRARQYFEDMEILGKGVNDFDEEILSQYADLDELEIRTVADLQQLSEMEGVEVELADLEKCSIPITYYNQEGWMKLLQDGNKGNFRLFTNDEEDNHFYVGIDTLEQLEIASKYMEFSRQGNPYKGWFSYEMTEQEMEAGDIIWASNRIGNSKTRLGMKVINGNLYQIAHCNGSTFVFLDDTNYPFEKFLEGRRNENNFEPDMNYDSSDR